VLRCQVWSVAVVTYCAKVIQKHGVSHVHSVRRRSRIPVGQMPCFLGAAPEPSRAPNPSTCMHVTWARKPLGRRASQARKIPKPLCQSPSHMCSIRACTYLLVLVCPVQRADSESNIDPTSPTSPFVFYPRSPVEFDL
jgi:hypothetical protein